MLTVLLYGTLSGILGTTLGGIIGTLVNKKSQKVMSLLLAFAAGVMLALVFFDLMPESIVLSNVYLTIAAVMLGMFCVLLLNDIIDSGLKKHNRLFVKEKDDRYILMRTGFMMAAAIAIHNFPEGLAIGVGEVINKGLTMTILIAMHDVPEGIAMAVPLRLGGCSRKKTILFCTLSGIPTVLGAVLGYYIGSISPYIIGTCIAAAGGAMLYVTFFEMLIQSNSLYKGRVPSVVLILGILVGLLVIFIV